MSVEDSEHMVKSALSQVNQLRKHGTVREMRDEYLLCLSPPVANKAA